MRALVAVFAVTLAAWPAFASITPSCAGAERAIRAAEEAAWLRRCVRMLQWSDITGDAEATCRRWLERCRDAPPARPGIMTY